MSRRTRQNTSVSLFPFLAVLLCAMGALIVLLVITTRQIRDEAIRVAEEKQSQPIDEQKPKSKQEEWPDWVIDLGEATPLATRKHSQPAAAPLQAPKPIYVKTEGAPSPPNLSADLSRLREKLNRLQETQSGTSADVKMIIDESAALKAEITKREKILNNAASAMEQITEQDQQTNKELDDLQKKTLQLSQDLQAKRAKNQKLANAPRNTPNVFKVVPYEGQSGTTRRPILIECTAGIIRFVPEGIELKERDLVGFSVQDNPLLSGVLAAEEYWIKRDQSVGDINRPYLLIVVRPDGIPAYYGARQLLQNYNQRFGYELVDQGQKLAYPQIDTIAQSTIQMAVDEDINKRGAPPQLARALFPSYDPRELEQTLTGRSISGDRIDGSLNETSTKGSRTNSNSRTGTGDNREKNDAPTRNFKFVQTSQGMVKVPLNDAEMKSFGRNDGASTGSDRRFKDNPKTDNGGPAKPKLIKPGIPSAGSRQVTEFPRSTTKTPSKEARSENLTTNQSADQSTAANPQNESQNMRSGDPTNQSASDARLSSLPPNAPDALTPILQERTRQQHANGTGQGESNQSSGQNQPQTSQGEGGASSSGQPGPPGQGFKRSSQPVKKMPFERPLRVAISDRGLRVDERDAISLPSNLQTQQLMNLTVEELRNRVKEWPAPPEQFFWRPMVKFYVYPNGENNYERLKPYFEKQGLLSDVKYVGSIPNQKGSRN